MNEKINMYGMKQMYARALFNLTQMKSPTQLKGEEMLYRARRGEGETRSQEKYYQIFAIMQLKCYAFAKGVP